MRRNPHRRVPVPVPGLRRQRQLYGRTHRHSRLQQRLAALGRAARRVSVHVWFVALVGGIIASVLASLVS